MEQECLGMILKLNNLIQFIIISRKDNYLKINNKQMYKQKKYE